MMLLIFKNDDMKTNTRKYMPLNCWDIYSVYFDKLIQQSKIAYDVKQLNSLLAYNLNQNVLNVLKEEQYDALVYTKPTQQIAWVSKGFTDMTGYPKSYAVGKKPTFLQGEQTSLETRKAIKQQLGGRRYIEETILNYKKNGDKYLCKIKIVPLYNKEDLLSGYLAIEKELNAA